MTVPQDVETDLTSPPQEGGFIYRMLTKIIGWGCAIGFIGILIATLVFIGLALWRGIIWLWPSTIGGKV